MPIQVFKVHHHASQELSNSMTQIDGLEVSFTLTAPSHVFVFGHVGFQHKKLPIPNAGDKYAIGIGARLKHNGHWVEGSKWGINIASGTDHYAIVPLDGYLFLQPGVHEISFWARCMTDAFGADPHPAKVRGNTSGNPGDPYNEMIVRVEPA